MSTGAVQSLNVQAEIDALFRVTETLLLVSGHRMSCRCTVCILERPWIAAS